MQTYLLTVSKPENEQNARKKHPIIVALMQKFRREQKHLGLADLNIGLKIYRLPYGLPDEGLKPAFFGTKNCIAKNGGCVREVNNVFCQIKYMLRNIKLENDFLFTNYKSTIEI